MARRDYPLSSSGALVDPVPVETHAAAVQSTSATSAKLAFPLAFFAVAATLMVLLAGILRINNGTFVYTLDDPYIHLALSDQLRHGNYGLYPGTHSAPSSSILFPFVLAIASGTALHPFLPLIINVCALFATVEIIRRFFLQLKLGTCAFAIGVQALLLFLMAFCFNLIGVVFTGLEHSLHIATVAAIIYGLALFLDRDRMPAWLPAAIILCPLVRYEGLALSLGALLVLALRGRMRTALATLAALALLLGGFSIFLIKLGLPPLPSSILTKSIVAAGGIDKGRAAFLAGIVRNVDFMVTHATGMVLLLIGVAAACICLKDLCIKPRRWTSHGLMALVLLAMIVGQAVAGRFGWIERYEDYILVGTAMGLVYLAQTSLREALSSGRKDRFLLVGGLAAGLLVFGSRYWLTTVDVPLTSNNIYEQQLQMHFFIDRFYRGPVAINDLGLSSYHNPYPVLDLGGLGSEAARKLFASHADAGAYETLVAANGVHLIMVYQEWFPDKIPDTWQHVATLSLSRRAISAAQSDVQFYVTDDATAVKVRQELIAFQKTLPPRVELDID